MCVMAQRSINPVADILVAIVLHGKKDYVENTRHKYKCMLLDIYSQHQVNCTCQSGHAYEDEEREEVEQFIDHKLMIVISKDYLIPQKKRD